MDNLNAKLPGDDLSFIVMPQAEHKYNYELQAEVAKPKAEPANKKWLMYLIAGLVILAALGGIGYYLWAGNDSKNAAVQPASKLPKIWLERYFNTQACDNPDFCGDDADPDKDGLSNYEEFKHGTDLVKPDTDGDGLADGDEVNIYKTDPTDKFTDKRTLAAENDYTDGHQIKNGYDPLTPGLKFTDVRKQQIDDDTAKYGLHEPTTTTL